MIRKSFPLSSILCCDPSLTAWGYVVITKKEQILEADCIVTKPSSKKMRIRKGDDRIRRISEINNVLIDLIQKYNVKLIISELPHGSQSAVGAIMIGIVSGIGQTISDCLDIPIEWYSEQDAKKCLLHKQSATKTEVIKAIDKLYEVPWKKVGFRDEAIADSMAIYNVAKKQSSSIRLII
jgi:Holliday junction resolvasome RuvABC endonuclease subunit